jgi:hypothetical protein
MTTVVLQKTEFSIITINYRWAATNQRRVKIRPSFVSVVALFFLFLSGLRVAHHRATLRRGWRMRIGGLIALAPGVCLQAWPVLAAGTFRAIDCFSF